MLTPEEIARVFHEALAEFACQSCAFDAVAAAVLRRAARDGDLSADELRTTAGLYEARNESSVVL